MKGLKIVSLFSGIGGVEAGLHRAGHSTTMFCEIDPAARAVLSHHFPDVRIKDDICALKSLPRCDVVTAGFPCQDLSLAGQKAGLSGSQSGLVEHMFRLIGSKNSTQPEWLLFENVPYMLVLDASKAMRSLVGKIEQAGYRWAYRVVDARSFGIPQRRQRIVLLASKTSDPRTVLFPDAREFPSNLPGQATSTKAFTTASIGRWGRWERAGLAKRPHESRGGLDLAFQVHLQFGYLLKILSEHQTSVMPSAYRVLARTGQSQLKKRNSGKVQDGVLLATPSQLSFPNGWEAA